MEGDEEGAEDGEYFGRNRERKEGEEGEGRTEGKRSLLAAGLPRLFAAAPFVDDAGKLSRSFAAIRGALRRRLAAADTPSVATLLSINDRTYSNGHFTFPPMDT